jgi:hypothetical protein
MYDGLGIEGLCAPALIYLIFGASRIIIDTYKGLYNLALMQVFITIIFTYLLNVLCRAGLGIVSWILIAIPFLVMSLIAGVLLVVFGLNPATGKAIKSVVGIKEKPGAPVKPAQFAYPIVVNLESFSNGSGATFPANAESIPDVSNERFKFSGVSGDPASFSGVLGKSSRPKAY